MSTDGKQKTTKEPITQDQRDWIHAVAQSAVSGANNMAGLTRGGSKREALVAQRSMPKTLLTSTPEILDLQKIVAGVNRYLDDVSSEMPELSELSTQAQNLTTLQLKLTSRTKKASKATGPNPQIRLDRTVLASAQTASRAIAERIKYIDKMRENNPFTLKQAFQSKRLDVQAGIEVVNRYKNDPNANQQQLTTIENELTKRRQRLELEMQNFDSNEHLDDPNEILSKPEGAFVPKGIVNEAKAKYAKVAHPIDNSRKHTAQEALRQHFEQGGTIGDYKLASSELPETDIVRIYLSVALANAGVQTDEKRIDAIQNQGHVKARNDQPWNKIERKVMFRDKEGNARECTSDITPASQMGEAFTTMDNKGVCAHDVCSYKHATTLANSEAKVDGKTVFSGLRHGVNCARGIRPSMLQDSTDDELKDMVQTLLPQSQWAQANGGPDRDATVAMIKNANNPKDLKPLAEAMQKAAGRNRALDIVLAALVKRPGEYNKALQGQVAKIELTSVGLMTPGAGNEGGMIDAQRQAWEDLDGKTHTITIDRPTGQVGPNGKPITQPSQIQVAVQVNAFNVGVNKPAFNSKFQKLGKLPIDKLAGSNQRNDAGNQRAYDALFKQSDDWLKAQQLTRPNLPKAQQEQLDKDVEVVTLLRVQIQALWEAKEYEKPGNEPYRFVSRLAVLANKIGQEPCFNCKSGKDRTSQMDVECKLLATEIAVNRGVPTMDRELSDNDKANRLEMAINSGSLELQQLNAGHMGYKLSGVNELDDSYGGKEKMDKVRGTSKQTDKYSAG